MTIQEIPTFGTTTTFKVKDVAALKQLLEPAAFDIHDLGDNNVRVLFDCEDSGVNTWVGFAHEYDENGEEIEDENGDYIYKKYDYPLMISKHLIEGGKAFFYETGHYGEEIFSSAHVINSKGKRRSINTVEIIALGEQL